MNVFTSIRIYPGEWSEKEVRDFTQEEIQAVSSAYVVESQYGLSVCFVMVGGGTAYIPCDRNSTKGMGESVDLSKAKLVTLCRTGEPDIMRVRC